MRYSITNVTVEQVKSVGAKDIKAPARAPVVFAELTEVQVAKLQTMGASVSKVNPVKANVSPPVPVAAVPIYTPESLSLAAGFEDLRAVTIPPLYGEGFNIAIIGTGIRETHEQLLGQVVYRKNYTSDSMADGFDHDTGCASIALVVAPMAGILNLKVLDSNGEGTEEEVTEAISDCIDLIETNPEIAPVILNLSLGSDDDGNPNNPMRIACRAAIESGLWVIASAGNQGPTTGTITSPACERYVAAVGSAKYDPFVVSEFSSRGPTKEGLIKPDMVFFGEDIEMASSVSDTATVARSGTSFSAPFISGLLSCWLEGVTKYIAGQAYELPTGVPAGITPLPRPITPAILLDTYLGPACLKPEGTPAARDDASGLGLPFGPLIAATITRPAMDIGSLIGAVMMLGMMGMMMKVVKK